MRIICLLYSLVILLMISGLKGWANYVSFALVLIVLVAVLARTKWVVPAKKIGICVFLFMLFYLLTSLLKLNSQFFFTEYAYYIIAFSPALVATVILRENDREAALVTLKFTMVIWFAMSIYSIMLYIYNPKFARLVAANAALSAGRVFGGYAFSVGSSLLCVYLFGLIWRRRKELKSKYAILVYTGCAILFITVYLTESTTTTFCTLVGIIATIFFANRGGGIQFRIYKIVLFCVVLLVLFLLINANIDFIYSWLYRKSDNLFFYRIREIIGAMFYDNETRHFAKRSDTLSESLNTFFKNPIIGVGYKYGNVTSVGKAEYGIGNHSELLDAFAQFGVIGALPFLMTYYLAVKKYAAENIGFVITIILLMLFNPFFNFDSNFVVFLVIPLFEFVMSGYKSNSY